MKAKYSQTLWFQGFHGDEYEQAGHTLQVHGARLDIAPHATGDRTGVGVIRADPNRMEAEVPSYSGPED
jgi:hypothetical protein